MMEISQNSSVKLSQGCIAKTDKSRQKKKIIYHKDFKQDSDNPLMQSLANLDLLTNFRGQHYEQTEFAVEETDSHSERSDLRPSNILPMQIVEVEVTHVESPNCFYVQKLVDYGKLSIIFNEINAIAHTLDPPSASVVSVGSCFLGQFSRDGNFYRAKILKKEENNMYFVRYIDYGNTESLVLSRLRPCPTKFNLHTIPPYEICCHLWGIEPFEGDEWTDQATNFFIELVTERRLKMCILHLKSADKELITRTCFVTLMRPAAVENYNALPIGDILIYFNHAKSYLDSELTASRETEGINFSYNLPDFPLNTEPMKVTVTSIDSPSCFFVQLNSNYKRWSDEMVKLQTHYHSKEIRSNSDWKIYVPKVGMACCVKFEHRWHRAKITFENGPSEITVMALDTGIEKIVAYNELRKLEKKFLSFPFQAIRCRLLDTIPILGRDKWSEDAIALFKTVLDTKNIKAVFCNKEADSYSITLRVDDGHEDVAQILVDNNYCHLEKRQSNSFFLAAAVEQLNINSLENSTFATSRRFAILPGRRGREQMIEMKKGLSFIRNALSSGTHSEQGVKHFVTYLDLSSLNAIYIRFPSQQNKFFQFLNELELINVNKANKKTYEPKVGEICVAILQKRKNYRARLKILSISSKDVVGFLMDIGGIQTVSKINLVPIKSKSVLGSSPPLAVVVSLVDVEPTCGVKKWSNTANEFAKEVLSTACDLFIIRKGKAYKDSDLYDLKVLPVELGWIHRTNNPFEEEFEFPTSFNEIIVDQGLALPIRNKQMMMPVSQRILLTSSKTPAEEPDIVTETSSPTSLGAKASFEFAPLTNILDIEPQMVKTTMDLLIEKSKCETALNGEERRFWKPPEPIQERVFLAKITNVDMAANISLYPVSQEAVLTEMSTVYEYEFKNSEAKDSDLMWCVGDPVIARYFQDNKWYRATVLRQNEEKISVEYIDYGNTDNVRVNDIRTKVSFMSTPIQNYKCVLANIEPVNPSGYTLDQLDFLHKLIVDKICRVTLVEPYEDGVKPKISLEIFETKTKVLTVLLDTKTCKLAKKTQKPKSASSFSSAANSIPGLPPVSSCGASDVVVEDDGNSYGSIEDSCGDDATVGYSSLANLMPQHPLPPVDIAFPVNVRGYSESDPSLIYISFPESLMEKVEALAYYLPQDSLSEDIKENSNLDSFYFEMQSLYETYNEMNSLMKEESYSHDSLLVPEREMMCLAYFSEENDWRRALILDVEDYRVLVLYIDYGCQDYVPLKWLRQFLPICHMVAPLCLLVKVRGTELIQPLPDLSFYTNNEFAITFDWLTYVPEARLLVKGLKGFKYFGNSKRSTFN